MGSKSLKNSCEGVTFSKVSGLQLGYRYFLFVFSAVSSPAFECRIQLSSWHKTKYLSKIKVKVLFESRD